VRRHGPLHRHQPLPLRRHRHRAVPPRLGARRARRRPRRTGRRRRRHCPAVPRPPRPAPALPTARRVCAPGVQHPRHHHQRRRRQRQRQRQRERGAEPAGAPAGAAASARVAHLHGGAPPPAEAAVRAVAQVHLLRGPGGARVARVGARPGPARRAAREAALLRERAAAPEARAAAGLLRQRLRARVRQVHGGPADVPVLRLGRALRGAAGAGRQGVRGRRLRALHGRPPGGAARRPPGPGGQPGDLGVDAPGPRGPGLRRRQGRAHGPAHQRDLLRLPARGRRPARRHCARLRPAGRRRQVPALLPRVPQGRRSGREAHLSYYGYDMYDPAC
jgi:hypothetical protein